MRRHPETPNHSARPISRRVQSRPRPLPSSDWDSQSPGSVRARRCHDCQSRDGQGALGARTARSGTTMSGASAAEAEQDSPDEPERVLLGIDGRRARGDDDRFRRDVERVDRLLAVEVLRALALERAGEDRRPSRRTATCSARRASVWSSTVCGLPSLRTTVPSRRISARRPHGALRALAAACLVGHEDGVERLRDGPRREEAARTEGGGGRDEQDETGGERQEVLGHGVGTRDRPGRFRRRAYRSRDDCARLRPRLRRRRPPGRDRHRPVRDPRRCRRRGGRPPGRVPAGRGTADRHQRRLPAGVDHQADRRRRRSCGSSRTGASR